MASNKPNTRLCSNKELSNKMNKADKVLYELGYRIMMYEVNETSGFYLQPYNPECGGIIRLYVDCYNDTHETRLVFKSGPFKSTSGRGNHSTQLTSDVASIVCDYWRKLIRAQKRLNDLSICGSREEIYECIANLMRRYE